MILKFRVFDKKYKKIMKLNEINFEKRSVWIEDDNGDHENRHTLTRGFDEVVLMQSTGLTDKHGVEIFEGDVVTSDLYPFTNERGKGYVGEVFYGKEDAMFLLELKCVDKNLGGISDGTIENFTDREVELYEVIGNIYSNPEMLEVAK